VHLVQQRRVDDLLHQRRARSARIQQALSALVSAKAARIDRRIDDWPDRLILRSISLNPGVTTMVS
jgi:hypothetical protein